MPTPPKATAPMTPATSFVPVPDPTVLTTQQLQREITASRDLVEVRIEGIKSVLETRLNAMDKAVDLLQPQALALVNHLKDLHAEKFVSIAQQFMGWDARISETTVTSQKAIDAALQAAEKAVIKMEGQFTKSVEEIKTLMNTKDAANADKVDDIKNRLTIIEGRTQGTANSFNVVVVVVGFLLTAGLIIATLLLMPHRP